MPLPIRVLHVPADHSYVCSVTPDSVMPVVIQTGLGVPHPVWTPGWLTANASAIDVVHVHFGYDHLTEPEMHSWLDELAQLAVRLVVTVHDLRNPHHDDPRRHDGHLALLVPAADALTTLTDAAADRIARRWGRRPLVVPHPPVVGSGPLPHRKAGDRPVVGVHLKDLRRNIVEPARVVAAAARGAARTGAVLRVNVHPGAAGRQELAAVHDLAATGAVNLRVHSRFGDEDLMVYLAGLDVSVLPYRFGTHSGWLEACRDVGTRVVAPSCGLYRHQWDQVGTYPADELRGLDEDGLAEAVAEAVRLVPVGVPGEQERVARLDRARMAHDQLYRAVLDLARDAA